MKTWSRLTKIDQLKLPEFKDRRHLIMAFEAMVDMTPDNARYNAWPKCHIHKSVNRAHTNIIYAYFELSALSLRYNEESFMILAHCLTTKRDKIIYSGTLTNSTTNKKREAWEKLKEWFKSESIKRDK